MPQSVSMTPADAEAREALTTRIQALFNGRDQMLRSLEITRLPGLWTIRAEIGLADRPGFAVSMTSYTAEGLYVAFLDQFMSGLARVDELMHRGHAKCWVCGDERERTKMEATVLGGELWWLCERCVVRRGNAQRLNVHWPTEYTAWLRRWRAEQRTAGRSDAWIADVEAHADALYETDPTLVNRMAAVERAVGERR